MPLNVLAGKEHVGDQFEQDYYIFVWVFDLIFSQNIHHQRQIVIGLHIESNDGHDVSDGLLNILDVQLSNFDECLDNFLQMRSHIVLSY